MSDPRLDILQPVMQKTGAHSLAIVPGANFRKIFGKEFHQSERPLVLFVHKSGRMAAIVPNLELASFAALEFKGGIFDWRDEAGYTAAFANAAQAMGDLGTLGVEGQTMRVFVQMAIAKAWPMARMIDAHAAISAIRLHKTPAEIGALREAIRLSEAALEATLREVRAGITETQVEAILLRNLFAAGVEGLSFGPIVAAGANAAKPHAKARPDYAIRPGDPLLLDFGGTFGGFCADITRTFFVSKVNDRDRQFYETVLAANTAGRAASKPGATCDSVDDAVQRVLEASPFAEFARHKTGHGLGIEVHEDPYIMRGNRQRLEPGMVFTVEPGLYRDGECGVRIEDNVVVTRDGAESLTQFPRELRIVG